ncbi:hypothetical protein J3E68DRAFT_420084 [Trichoderma sp. SZMC 28012]
MNRVVVLETRAIASCKRMSRTCAEMQALVGFVGNAHILALCGPSSDQGAGTGDVDHDDFVFFFSFFFDFAVTSFILRYCC